MKKLHSRRTYTGQVSLPVHRLYPISNRSQHTNLEEITKAVYNNGMEWPLIGWEIEVQDWAEEAKRNNLILPPPQELSHNSFIIQIRCGNKRLRYAKDLGYTHIDCYIAQSLDEVAEKMKEQQDWYKKYKHLQL